MKQEKTMKKKHGVYFGFAVLLITAIFTLAGCGNGNDGGDDPELAKWNGTWNRVYDYLDDPELVAILQAQYDSNASYKERLTFDEFQAFVKAIAVTDFGSFVVQGDTITFYDQKQTQKNPSGNVIETVTYAYKGIQKITWQGEEADFYAFEGDKAGAHTYLIFEEAERDTPDGPLHFHMRYGSESVDSLLDNNTWAPTIVGYDTTIDELKVFMSGD
jgi:Zn/Cd-binding protein ZinT